MLPEVNKVSCNFADYLLFDNKDAISRTLIQTGDWEPHLQAISSVFYRDALNPVIVDVGANLGAYSIPIAKKIQSIGGSVIAFEPQRIVYYQLCGNIILNRLDNYFAHHKAVGNINSLINIPETDFAENYNVGGFSIEQKYRENLDLQQFMNKNSFHVEIVKLDHISTDSSIKLIKIDVEGSELDVIRGGIQLLEAHNFPPILFECWSLDWFSEKKAELFSLLNQLGYKIFSMRDDHIAQHPRCEVQVDFDIVEENGYNRVNMVRTK